MAPDKEFGPPSRRVPPAENQVPEPQLWPLLYDLNGKVTRMDEAVDGLKERAGNLDHRVESFGKDAQAIGKEVSALRGSINTLKWVFAILIPVATVVLETLLKRIWK